MRIGCILAAAVLCAGSPQAAESASWGFARHPRSGPISIAVPSPMPFVGDGDPLVPAALAFTVSVCLADVEYSFGCWESSSLEAARRLEQIFMDDYATRRATGSLQIWFPLNAPQSEQLRFLREVEDRAIEGATRKLQAGVDNPDTPPADLLQAPAQSSDQGSTDQAQLFAQLLQRRHQDIQKWREDATSEARKGSNWSHEWASRTHIYKPGPALDQLVQSASSSQSGDR